MVLDLGGVAKGYIADRMLEVLKDYGFSRSLVDAGGDLRIGDAPLGSAGWKIEISGRKYEKLTMLKLAIVRLPHQATPNNSWRSMTRNTTYYRSPNRYWSCQSSTSYCDCSNRDGGRFTASTFLVTGFEKATALIKKTNAKHLYFLEKRGDHMIFNEIHRD